MRKLPVLIFDYSYQGQGWGEAHISDGLKSYGFAPSYVLNDPLYELTKAIAGLLCGEKETRCRWFEEPSELRWVLKRDEEELDISILSFPGFQPTINHPEIVERDREPEFSTVCDFWRFAARLRVHASRFLANEMARKDGYGYWSNTPEYQTLCTSLEERKHLKKQEE